MANVEHVEILSQGVEVWNNWRDQLFTRKIETTPDLSGFDLSDRNLKGINFGSANLSGANLSGANLSVSYLRRAVLKEANLTDTNLSGSFVTLADLTGALLKNTDLCGSFLGKSKVHGATFGDTKLGNTDLTSTEGLESIVHEGPSSLGIDTVLLSETPLPEVFLRGCGVPEEVINYIPSFTNRPVEFYSCFISYSHADKAFARQLHDFLQGRGIRCWLDEHQLFPGHDIFEEVDRGIKLWDKVLLCASKDSLTSWWVDNEINRAFKKEQTLMRERGKKVLALIPLDLDGFLFSGWERGFAEQVKSRLVGDFVGWQSDNKKMQDQLERVVKALRTDGGRQEPPNSLL